MPREQVGRRIAQLALAGLSLLLLAWLANIVYRYDDGLLPVVVELFARSTWLAVLVTLLVLILAAQVVLMDPVYGVLFQRGPRGAAQNVFMVGCSGCGTVFDRRENELDEEHERRFACPNCGRVGQLKDLEVHAAHIDRVTCPSCEKSYRQYKERAECPHCGASHEGAAAPLAPVPVDGGPGTTWPGSEDVFEDPEASGGVASWPGEADGDEAAVDAEVLDADEGDEDNA